VEVEHELRVVLGVCLEGKLGRLVCFRRYPVYSTISVNILFWAASRQESIFIVDLFLPRLIPCALLSSEEPRTPFHFTMTGFFADPDSILPNILSATLSILVLKYISCQFKVFFTRSRVLHISPTSLSSHLPKTKASHWDQSAQLNISIHVVTKFPLIHRQDGRPNRRQHPRHHRRSLLVHPGMLYSRSSPYHHPPPQSLI
jgi:hypothetical protein